MQPVLKFAPCSAERLQHRLQEGQKYEEAKTHMVQFWDCESAEQYRQLEREGKGVFDPPQYDPHAVDMEIPSSHGPHKIPLRVLKPQCGTPRGSFLFIHGGGFVIGSATLHDNVLRDLAEKTGLVMVSVEYRLAPEFKLPAGTDDCLDAALYLLSAEARQRFGSGLRVIGGESAGGYLTVQTTLRLRDQGVNVRDELAAIIPTYGLYDLSLLPGVRVRRPLPAAKHAQEDSSGKAENARDYVAASVPKEVYTSKDLIKSSEWSPLYADLHDLPPASFSVGTEDGLIDDSILLSARWQLAGNEAELIIYPGTPHGYQVVRLDVTDESIDDLVKFVKVRL